MCETIDGFWRSWRGEGGILLGLELADGSSTVRSWGGAETEDSVESRTKRSERDVMGSDPEKYSEIGGVCCISDFDRFERKRFEAEVVRCCLSFVVYLRVEVMDVVRFGIRVVVGVGRYECV